MNSLSLLGPPEAIYPPRRTRISLLSTIWKRRRVGFIVFGLTMSLTVLCALLLPRRYEASMQYMVNNDRVNSPVGSDNSTQAIVYMDDVNENRVNTEVALLSSNDLMLQLVESAGLANVKGSKGSQESRTEAALKDLKEHLRVTPLRKSAIIDVRYTSTDREQAVRVLKVLSALYLDAHVRLHGTTGAHDVFEQLWTQASAQRAAAESALRDFKQEHNIVSLPDEKTIALQREADLQKQYADAVVAAKRTGKQTEALNGMMTSIPASVVGERKTLPNQSEVEHLRSVLSGLQLKRVEAASRYVPTDRVVTDLDQQISETNAAIALASTRNAEEVSLVANPVFREAETAAVRGGGDYAGYQEQAAELGRKLAVNRRRLLALDEQTAEYNGLSENVNRFAQLEHDYRQKADAARVDQFLDRNHVSNVNLAENPFAPPQRSPRMAAVLAVGLLWSLIASGAAVLFVDRFRARVTSPIDVERSLGAPVIAFLSTRAGIAHPYGCLPAVYMHIVRQPSRKIRRLA